MGGTETRVKRGETEKENLETGKSVLGVNMTKHCAALQRETKTMERGFGAKGEQTQEM